MCGTLFAQGIAAFCGEPESSGYPSPRIRTPQTPLGRAIRLARSQASENRRREIPAGNCPSDATASEVIGRFSTLPIRRRKRAER